MELAYRVMLSETGIQPENLALDMNKTGSQAQQNTDVIAFRPGETYRVSGN